jgi:hypothetical protein
MPVTGGGFEQCRNTQALVATDRLLAVTIDGVQAPNDEQPLEPMVEKLATLALNAASPFRTSPRDGDADERRPDGTTATPRPS